jgi:hypothetical protein
MCIAVGKHIEGFVIFDGTVEMWVELNFMDRLICRKWLMEILLEFKLKEK